MLDIAKIESGRIVLEESDFDLHELSVHLQSLMSVKALEKGVTFAIEHSPDLPRFMTADAGKLRQVLLNLVGNAIKYTPRGSVTLRIAKRRKDAPRRVWLRFEVEDTGPGIPISDRSRIFSPFIQLQNRQTTDAGTGLGLTISKQNVMLMGGEIGIGGEPGKGAIFYFDIPLGLQDDETNRTAPAAAKGGGTRPGRWRGSRHRLHTSCPAGAFEVFSYPELTLFLGY